MAGPWDLRASSASAQDPYEEALGRGDHEDRGDRRAVVREDAQGGACEADEDPAFQDAAYEGDPVASGALGRKDRAVEAFPS